MLFPTTPTHSPNYDEEIRALVNQYDSPVRVGVTSPYVTSDGLREFTSGDWIEESESRWLVGLNQGITTPSVLRDLHSDSNTTLRVFLPRDELTDEALKREPRLHAKVAGVGSKSNHDQQSLIISSANITGSAMGVTPSNYELGVCQSYPDSLSKEAIEQFREWWEEVWSHGVDVDESLIDSYESIRNNISKEVTEDSKNYGGLEGEANEAKYMWTDTGSMQGEDRYLLEIKEEIADFFHEKCRGTGQLTIEHRGKKYDRKIKFDEGHYTPQWRVYLPTDFSAHDESYYRYKSAFFEKRRDEYGNRYYHLEIRETSHTDVDMWKKKSDEYGVQSETDAPVNSRRYGYW